MLVKQGMSKSQACDALKARPRTIDHIRRSYNLQSAYYFVQRRKRPKKKTQDDDMQKEYENKKETKSKNEKGGNSSVGEGEGTSSDYNFDKTFNKTIDSMKR